MRNQDTGLDWNLRRLKPLVEGRISEPLQRGMHPKTTGESDHLILLRDGRADHMGKGVTDICISQRQLVPDRVGPDTTKPTFLRKISFKAGVNKTHRFQNLYGQLNESLLLESWKRLNKRGVSGVDKVSVAQYSQNLSENISKLVERLKTNEYRSRLIRRKYIPKGNGKERPLGIPVVEDRLLQGAVSLLLDAIFDQDFHALSYGYRRGVGAQKAAKDLQFNLQFGSYGYVVEADIKGFFDNINHGWLLRMIQERVDDQPLIGLIDSWLKAGILEPDGFVFNPESGTPQGGVISPILANIYLHYVVDHWFEKRVRRQSSGQCYMIRYADDFVCAFQYKRDADRFYQELPERLGKFSLKVAPEKTCIHRFSRFHPTRKTRFQFLGFEYYWEADSKGIPRVWKRTARKKLRESIHSVKEWLKLNRHTPIGSLLSTMKRKVQGHFNYFRVVGNASSIWVFFGEVKALLYKWLNRRSQRRSLTWKQLYRVLEFYNFPAL